MNAYFHSNDFFDFQCVSFSIKFRTKGKCMMFMLITIKEGLFQRTNPRTKLVPVSDLKLKLPIYVPVCICERLL